MDDFSVCGAPSWACSIVCTHTKSLNKSPSERTVAPTTKTVSASQTDFTPLSFGQELANQLITALKFGLFVQIGLGITLLGGFPLALSKESSFTPMTLVVAYIPAVLCGYILVRNKLNFRIIIVPMSCLLLGVVMYMLHRQVLSEPENLGFGPMTGAASALGTLELFGMILAAPIMTLVVYPLMTRVHQARK